MAVFHGMYIDGGFTLPFYKVSLQEEGQEGERGKRRGRGREGEEEGQRERRRGRSRRERGRRGGRRERWNVSLVLTAHYICANLFSPATARQAHHSGGHGECGPRCVPLPQVDAVSCLLPVVMCVCVCVCWLLH